MPAIAGLNDFQADLAASDRRTRRFTTISLAVHAALLLWWVVAYQISPVEDELIEITWLEPEPLNVATAPAPEAVVEEPVAEAEPVAQAPVAKESFERPEPVAPVEPEVQRPSASSDKLARSLDDLRARPPKADLSALAAKPSTQLSRPATTTTRQAVTTRRDLARGTETDRPAPATLRRDSSPRVPSRSTLASVDVPRPTGAKAHNVDASSARRVLDGALLAGEVADRALIEKTMPLYPERARREAVEATIELGFTVLADGRVKPDVRVERGSGHADFDRNAIEALRTWRFESLPAGRSGEQWGVITFQFRLRDR